MVEYQVQREKAPEVLVRLTDDERRRLQILIISDGAALQHVLGERDRIGAGLAAPPPSDVDARIGAVKDIAELLGYVDTMRTASAIQSAEQAQAEWELMWTVVGGLVSLIPLSAPYAVATGVATAGLRAGLEAAGVGPRSVASVRAETLQSFATMTTVASAVLLCSTFDSMVANGQVPPDAEPPPVPDLAAEHPGLEYDTAVLGWLQRSGFEDAVQDELNGTKQQIASTHEMAVDANCAILGC